MYQFFFLMITLDLKSCLYIDTRQGLTSSWVLLEGGGRRSGQFTRILWFHSGVWCYAGLFCQGEILQSLAWGGKTWVPGFLELNTRRWLGPIRSSSLHTIQPLTLCWSWFHALASVWFIASGKLAVVGKFSEAPSSFTFLLPHQK